MTTVAQRHTDRQSGVRRLRRWRLLPRGTTSEGLPRIVRAAIALLMSWALLVSLVAIYNELTGTPDAWSLVSEVTYFIFVLALPGRSPAHRFLPMLWGALIVFALLGLTSGANALLASFIYCAMAFGAGRLRAAFIRTGITYAWFIPTVVRYSGSDYDTPLPSQVVLLTTALLIVCFPVWLAGRNLRRSRTAAELLEQAELQAGLERIEERRHLATELHDGLARDLVVINLAVRTLPADALPRGAPDIEKVSANALANLAHLVTVLRRDDSVVPGAALDAETKLDVPGALTHQAERLRGAGLDVTLDITLPSGLRFPETARLVLVRVLSEGTTNILEQAPGAEVHLAVRADRERLTLDLANTLPPGSAVAAGDPPGTTALDERVRLHGGVLDSGLEDDGRWHLRVDMPLAAPRPAATAILGRSR